MVKANQTEIFVNDDGQIINHTENLLKLSDLKDKMIDTYKDTPLTTLLWAVGGHEVYDYETTDGVKFKVVCDPKSLLYIYGMQLDFSNE